MIKFIKLVFALAASLQLAGCASDEVKHREQEARENAHKAQAMGPNIDSYKIGSGDTLKIEYIYNEELNRSVVVRPDGFVSLPYLADVQVAGKTVEEAKSDLAAKYKGLLKNPVLTVSLDAAANFKVYVGGEVVSPGVFPLATGVTALRAVTMAGGIRPTAGLRSVMIIRDKGGPKPEYLMVDLHAGVAKLDGQQDLLLEPRDMVFVPKSRIASIDQFVDQYMNQLIPFQKALGVSYVIGPAVY
jgi:protein involved in polysaccharide export with SLBB domain